MIKNIFLVFVIAVILVFLLDSWFARGSFVAACCAIYLICEGTEIDSPIIQSLTYVSVMLAVFSPLANLITSMDIDKYAKNIDILYNSFQSQFDPSEDPSNPDCNEAMQKLQIQCATEHYTDTSNAMIDVGKAIYLPLEAGVLDTILQGATPSTSKTTCQKLLAETIKVCPDFGQRYK